MFKLRRPSFPVAGHDQGYSGSSVVVLRGRALPDQRIARSRGGALAGRGRPIEWYSSPAACAFVRLALISNQNHIRNHWVMSRPLPLSASSVNYCG